MAWRRVPKSHCRIAFAPTMFIFKSGRDTKGQGSREGENF